MPLFSSPDHRPLEGLGSGLGALFGFVGWATIGMGLLPYGIVAALAVVGGCAAMLQERAFGVSLIIETVALGLALAVATGAQWDWVALGGLVAVLSRAAAYGIRRYFSARGE